LLIVERDMRAYGSRGQQRTAALAVKLAEVAVMTSELERRRSCCWTMSCPSWMTRVVGRC